MDYKSMSEIEFLKMMIRTTDYSSKVRDLTKRQSNVLVRQVRMMTMRLEKLERCKKRKAADLRRAATKKRKEKNENIKNRNT